jgi:hypothetical protein
MQALDEARALRCSGQAEQALMAYRQLLLLHPEVAEAWAEYAGHLLSMGRPGEALEASLHACSIQPHFPPAQGLQGRALLRLGRRQEAEEILRELVTRDPVGTEARLDLARCLIGRGALDEATETLLQGATRDPGNPVITTLLMDIYIKQERWLQLHQEMLRRAAEDYSGPVAEWEISNINLQFGVMPLGWDQHESRWSHPSFSSPRRDFPQATWNGEPFPGRTLLLHWEQGFGDTLMLVRYASRVKQLGGRVLLLAQPELADLVATCPGIDEVCIEGRLLPPFDLHLPLFSLPRVFRTTLDTIPAEVPYLDIPAQVPNRQGLRERLAPVPGRHRIGISWEARFALARASQKSVPPEFLRPLGDLPGVDWFALQHGTDEVPPLPGIVSLSPLLSTFSDTAYALAGLDLVITIDTALAHLAGALGIPTLLLACYLPDWRWLMGRSDSPWYPSMRIYRQPRASDWESVIQKILQDFQ